MPMFSIDFGIYFSSLPFFDFLYAFGRGGIPFYAFSGGIVGSSIGLSDEISSPLLQIGHVRYY